MSENFRCSQAFWLLKQCRWRLQNVQKRQSQIVQLWQNKLAHIDKLMASYDVHKSGHSGYTKVIKYELNKWKINY